MNLDDLDIPDIMNRIDSAIDEMHDTVETKIIAEQEYKDPNDIANKIDNATETLKGPLERQLAAIESIADSAKTQSNLAIIQSETADKTSHIANLKSTLSLIFAAISMIGTLLANADGIVHNVQKILSHLNMLIQ